MSKRPKLEKTIQAEIEAAIGAEPDFLLLRNAVGKATFYNDEGKAYHSAFGLGTGSPDLVGILGPHGRWLCLEVKVPGEEAEPHQEVCHQQWRVFGALVYVVHSVDEARSALTAARGAK